MGKRLSKIYTRTGDDGTTGLADGSRLEKDHDRVEAMGAVDELNSLVGMVLSQDLPQQIRDSMTEIQHDLFDLGGELAIPAYTLIKQQHVDQLEKTLDKLNADLPALQEFILPAGDLAVTSCHLARSVCRRAERRCVTLNHHEALNPVLLQYLNRLSDLLFVIARSLSRASQGTEVFWNRDQLRKHTPS